MASNGCKQFLTILKGKSMKNEMNLIIEQVKGVLDSALFLNGRALLWGNQMSLLGNVPELDSMAVMNVVSALELKFSITIEDDDINADVFATIETLTFLVCQKLENNLYASA
jgi:acyl carrier protein